MFFLIYIRSFFLVLGRDRWFLLWRGLEINIISFIIVIYDKRIIKIEVCLKYFFIQGVGSSVLLLVLIMKGWFFKERLILILRYKIGSGPFFFWFPSFCEGISWNSCVIVISMQKFLPLFFIYLFICSLGWLILLLRIVSGVIGCFNESKLKKFMAFSSIHYVGWIILCIICNRFLWLIYLAGYAFILIGVLLRIRFNEIIRFKDLLRIKSPGLFILSILNIGGIPPILGFFLKWWVFLIILPYKFEIIWLVLFLAVCIFYVYARIVYFLMVDYNLNIMYRYTKIGGLQILRIEWLFLIFIFVSPALGWILL